MNTSIISIMAFTLGVSGLIGILVGAFAYTEGSLEIWWFEPLRFNVTYPIWTGGLSVLFGAAMLALISRKN